MTLPRPSIALLAKIRRRLAPERVLDLLLPKRRLRWAFALGPGEPWSGNLQAIARCSLASTKVEVIVVVDGADLERVKATVAAAHPSEPRIRVVRRFSVAYGTSGVLFVTDGLPAILRLPTWSTRKRVILVWHGIGFKAVGLEAPFRRGPGERRRYRRRARRLAAIAASSEENSHRMTRSFGLSPNSVWPVGYPRTDWLVNPEAQLPDDVRREIELLRELRGGRPLILYAPTWETVESGQVNVSALLEALTSAFPYALVGRRLHPFVTVAPPLGSREIDLGGGEVCHLEALLRMTTVLITDFSSIWVDHLLTGGAIVGYGPSPADYRQSRGLAAEYEEIFPGPFSTDIDSTICAVSQALEGEGPSSNDSLVARFHAQPLGYASERFVDRVLALVDAPLQGAGVSSRVRQAVHNHGG